MNLTTTKTLSCFLYLMICGGWLITMAFTDEPIVLWGFLVFNCILLPLVFEKDDDYYYEWID